MPPGVRGCARHSRPSAPISGIASRATPSICKPTPPAPTTSRRCSPHPPAAPPSTSPCRPRSRSTACTDARRRWTLPPGIVLALEKPFGDDARSARSLNRLLQTMVPEEQVFRVDHFLGKSTILNLIGLRFANRIFEPLLSAENVAHVEIIIEESIGLEGRAGYYDQAGALVDMIQSHLLLVLALATMEAPSSVGSEDLRGAMAQVLRATRPWKRDGTASRRARYTAGTVGRRKLPAYTAEEGVVAVPAHRDTRRADRRDRHLALGRGAVRPALRQGDRAARGRRSCSPSATCRTCRPGSSGPTDPTAAAHRGQARDPRHRSRHQRPRRPVRPRERRAARRVRPERAQRLRRGARRAAGGRPDAVGARRHRRGVLAHRLTGALRVARATRSGSTPTRPAPAARHRGRHPNDGRARTTPHPRRRAAGGDGRRPDSCSRPTARPSRSAWARRRREAGRSSPRRSASRSNGSPSHPHEARLVDALLPRERTPRSARAASSDARRRASSRSGTRSRRDSAAGTSDSVQHRRSPSRRSTPARWSR